MRLFAVLALFLMAIPPLSASEEVMGKHAGFKALKPYDFACGSAVRIEILSDKKENLESANKDLLKMVGLIRTIISLECPQAKRIILTGKHSRGRAFKTKISKNENWQLNLANNELPSYRKRSPEEKELRIPHRTGKLLAETDEAFIHLNRATTFSLGMCGDYSPWVSIVFKSSFADKVQITEQYLMPFFRDKVVPAVEYECGAGSNFSVRGQLYIEGIFFSQKGEEVPEKEVLENVYEERFGFFSVKNYEGKIIPGDISLFGQGINVDPERRTLAGLRATRDRGWATVEQAQKKRALAEKQKKLLGIEISDGAVWRVVNGEVLTSSYYKLGNPKAKRLVRRIAQAYGRSAIEICGDSIPGGATKIAFINNVQKSEVTITDKISAGSTIINIPGNLGRSTFNDITGSYSGIIVLRVFLKYAKEGIIREEFDKVIKAQGCLSPIHKKLHSNIKALAERHSLI